MCPPDRQNSYARSQIWSWRFLGRSLEPSAILSLPQQEIGDYLQSVSRLPQASLAPGMVTRVGSYWMHTNLRESNIMIESLYNIGSCGDFLHRNCTTGCNPTPSPRNGNEIIGLTQCFQTSDRTGYRKTEWSIGLFRWGRVTCDQLFWADVWWMGEFRLLSLRLFI